jgi:hypothetical protein
MDRGTLTSYSARQVNFCMQQVCSKTEGLACKRCMTKICMCIRYFVSFAICSPIFDSTVVDLDSSIYG